MEYDLNYLETVVEQAALILQQSGCETNNLHVLRGLRRYQLDSVFNSIVTDDDDRTYIFLIGHSKIDKDDNLGALRFDDDEYLAEQQTLFYATHSLESFDFLQMYLKKEDLYNYLVPIRGKVVVFLGGCKSGAFIDGTTFSPEEDPLLTLDQERYSFVAGAAANESAKYSGAFGSFMLHTILEKCFENNIADVNTNDGGILLSELRQKVKTAIIDNHTENERTRIRFAAARIISKR